jgi:hypothetical protein
MYVAVFIMQWHYHTFTAAAKIAQWVKIIKINIKSKHQINFMILFVDEVKTVQKQILR